MATLTVEIIDGDGLAATYNSAASGGDNFANPTEDILVHAKNTASAARVITVNTPATIHGEAIANPTISVPATTGERFFGPFNKDVYNASGKVSLTYDNNGSLTIAVLRAKKR